MFIRGYNANRVRYERDDVATTGGDAPEETGSPFDTALDSLMERSEAPTRTPPQDGNNAQAPDTDARPSDPNFKATTRQQPQQPAAGANPAQAGEPQRGTQQQQTPQGARRVRADQNNNLVDVATGEVVARAGAERRFFEAARQARAELARVQTAVSQMEATVRERDTALAAYREAANSYTSLGLEPQEVTMAMQLMSNYKRNPLEAIRYMLTEAQAAGHNVASITSGSGIDTAAIARLIDQRLAPFTQDRQSAQAQETAYNNARTVWQTLANERAAYGEDINIHADAIANLLRRDDNMTLREAYLTLGNWALANGYDMGQPLAPQIQARQAGNTAQQQQPPADNLQSPGTNGVPPVQRRNVGATANTTEMRPARAGEFASNRDLVREAMREAGMNVS